MADCRYCGREFDDDAALDAHLRDEHRDELGPIDRRRIEERDADGGGLGLEPGPIALLGVLGIATAIVIYIVFFASSGGSGVPTDQVAQTPTDVGGPHFHGTINVTIDGERIDFSRAEYQNPREYPAFHFEGGDGQTWHGHARGITLEYAMATLDIHVTEDSVRYGGTTYDGTEPGTTVVVEVNDESVDPQTYELAEGDHVHISVSASD